MSPRDVPGPLEIDSLFPWLAQLAPAAVTPHPSAPATPSPSTVTDLPKAA